MGKSNLFLLLDCLADRAGGRTQLAKQIGVTRGMMFRYCTDTEFPKSRVEELAGAVGVPVDRLLAAFEWAERIPESGFTASEFWCRLEGKTFNRVSLSTVPLLSRWITGDPKTYIQLKIGECAMPNVTDGLLNHSIYAVLIDEGNCFEGTHPGEICYVDQTVIPVSGQWVLFESSDHGGLTVGRYIPHDREVELQASGGAIRVPWARWVCRGVIIGVYRST